MPAETHEKALEAELRAEARLDAADPHAVAECKAGVWCELRGVWRSGPSQRVKKRRAGAEIGGNDARSVRLRKRRGALGSGRRRLRRPVWMRGCTRGAGWRQGEERS